MKEVDRATWAVVWQVGERGEGKGTGPAAVRAVWAGLGVVAGEGRVEGGRQHCGHHVWLPAHQDVGGRGVGERGGGCEQGGRSRVGAVDPGVVGRRWEQGEVERLRDRRGLPGWAGEGAGEALVLGQGCSGGLEEGGFLQEAGHIGGDVGGDATNGPNVGGRGGGAVGRGPGDRHRRSLGGVSREGFQARLGRRFGSGWGGVLGRPSGHMLDMRAGVQGGSPGRGL